MENISFKTNASALASIAGNRRKLYDLIQKKYDLPNFSPCITENYLQELIRPKSKFLKVKRDETHPIPKGVRKAHNSL